MDDCFHKDPPQHHSLRGGGITPTNPAVCTSHLSMIFRSPKVFEGKFDQHNSQYGPTPIPNS